MKNDEGQPLAWRVREFMDTVKISDRKKATTIRILDCFKSRCKAEVPAELPAMLFYFNAQYNWIEARKYRKINELEIDKLLAASPGGRIIFFKLAGSLRYLPGKLKPYFENTSKYRHETIEVSGPQPVCDYVIMLTNCELRVEDL